MATASRTLAEYARHSDDPGNVAPRTVLARLLARPALNEDAAARSLRLARSVLAIIPLAHREHADNALWEAGQYLAGNGWSREDIDARADDLAELTRTAQLSDRAESALRCVRAALLVTTGQQIETACAEYAAEALDDDALTAVRESR